MLQFIALALLCTTFIGGTLSEPLKAGGAEAGIRSTKDDFELVFGAKAEPLRSKASLALAIDDVTAHSARMVAKTKTTKSFIGLSDRDRALIDTAGGSDHFSYSRKLGCLPYSTAVSFLRDQETKEVRSKVVPFLVNKARNAICVFFTNVAPEVKEDFIFHYDIPVSLVIDKDLYAVVDSMFRTNATLHQALGAKPESRQQEVLLVAYPYKDEPRQASTARIQHVVDSIATYPTEVFESFFWANKNVSDYLERMCSQRRLDSLTKGGKGEGEGDGDGDGALLYLDTQRHATWSALFSHLESHVHANAPLPRELLAAEAAGEVATTNKGKTTADPCQFRRMSSQMHAYADRVVFPMDYLQSYKDEKLASACLAFLGARLAMPTLLQSGHRGSDIFHVALEYGPSLYNYRARSIPQSKTSAKDADAMPYLEAGIRGANQVVGVADTGIDRSSCYFEDPAGMVEAELVPSKSFDPQYRKVIQYVYIQGQADDTDTASGHGTHVAGTVAGSVSGGGGGGGGGEELYDGAAPDAKLAFLDMTSSGDGGLAVPDSAADLYEPSYAAGARLHSNSWGSNHDGQGYYTNSDSDGWLYDHQDYLALYAGGNNGGAQNYLMSQESQGKNCLAVGAGESPTSIASFSSVGPAYDNRFKPDIVLPGSGTISAEASGGFGGSTCTTGSKSGTSMATPAASGNAALIRDYLATQWAEICMDPGVTPDSVPGGKDARCVNVEEPSGVLIKALLLHGGEKMSTYASSTQLGDAPDSKQGYGILFLGNVLPLPAAGLTFGLFVHDYASIASEESIIYTVMVTDSSRPLKVTLSWYDPANQNGISTTALLHDLDLSVTSESGTAYWGNHLSEAGNKPDRLNNNEQVMIAEPEEGMWTVKVAANSLVKDESQAFSLVVTNTGYAYEGEGDQQPPVDPSEPSPKPTRRPVPVPVPAPDPGSTARPTSPEDGSPKDPPEWADDDHFHHRHPGNDDWHSHKRKPGAEDDYVPPSPREPRTEKEEHSDLSPFERRLINAIRGVFAPAE